MSSDGDDETTRLVQELCCVSEARARELLEAGGSVERAFEIHTSQSHVEPSSTTHSAPRKRTNQQHKQLQGSKQFPPDGSRKQAVVSSFFSPQKRARRQAENDTDDCHTSRDATAITLQTKKAPSTATVRKDIKTTLKDENPPCDVRLQYVTLATAFSEMVATSKRLEKIECLRLVLLDVIKAVGGIKSSQDSSREADAKVLQCTLELIMGSVSGMTLQVSGAAVSKAVREVTGASANQLRDAYRRTGDLGDAAESFSRNQRLLIVPRALSILSVHGVLCQIASLEGKGSQSKRHNHISQLLRSCRSNERLFLVRTLLGNMRLGANIKTILTALELAVEDLTPMDLRQETEEKGKIIQRTFDICPRLDKISLALLMGGVTMMQETCVLEVGTPIQPMLANPAHSLEEVAKLLKVGGMAVCEWKYDGMRCQAHFDGSKVVLFSRHLHDTTSQFPDAVEYLLKAHRPLSGSQQASFIVDAEIVGCEKTKEGDFALLPFQMLSTRRGSAQEAKIAIRLYAFDLMFLNGESIVHQNLACRQELLRKTFEETEGFTFADSMRLEHYDANLVSSFLKKSVIGGAEGLMVKLLGTSNSTSQAGKSCPYESGTRSHSWLKVKRDYVDGFGDTIDVVPIGAWHGNGRKAQKGFLSPVLLAVYDDQEDVYRSICRCMSFTDAMYDAMREYYFNGVPYPNGVGVEPVAEDAGGDAAEGEASDREGENEFGEDDDENNSERVNCYAQKPSALIVTNEKPTIWFKPSEVFEVGFADLSLSRQHTAAAGLVDDGTRGVALRFPRFKRRRPDKRVDQATTSIQIAELFAKQSKQSSRS